MRSLSGFVILTLVWFVSAGGAQDKRPAPATIEVRCLPAAELFFDGTPTTQRGPMRRFFTPPLERGFTYTYELTARWTTDGKPHKESRTINVRAGETTNVDLLPPKKKDKDKEKPTPKSTGVKLQGTWRVLEYHNDGSELPKEKLKGMTVVIKDDVMSIGVGGKGLEKYTFSLDPKTTPAGINVRPTDGSKGEFRGIYELKGDTLWIGLRLKGD